MKVVTNLAATLTDLDVSFNTGVDLELLAAGKVSLFLLAAHILFNQEFLQHHTLYLTFSGYCKLNIFNVKPQSKSAIVKK